MQRDGTYIKRRNGEHAVDSQTVFMEEAKKAAEVVQKKESAKSKLKKGWIARIFRRFQK